MRNEKHKGPRELCTGGEWIYGRNPVIEALRAGRRTFSEVVLPPPDKNEADELAVIRATARDRNIVVRTEDRKRLDLLTRGGHHQGVALKTSGYPYVAFEDILEDVRADEGATVVVLDHLEDPQNVGSILRTACAVGATGVILPEDRGCGVTPAAVRASAGASEYLKVARVVNLVRAMKQLQEAGMWFTGLDWGEDAKAYTRSTSAAAPGSWWARRGTASRASCARRATSSRSCRCRARSSRSTPASPPPCACTKCCASGADAEPDARPHVPRWHLHLFLTGYSLTLHVPLTCCSR